MEVDRIEPAKTAMIVVDMQNDFVAPGGGLETPAARAMVPRLVEALQLCRSAGIKVIYTTHAHRRDGSDMGLFAMHQPIAARTATVDGTWGIEIYPEVAPAAGEHVIKRHRYSGFFGTDLDIILLRLDKLGYDVHMIADRFPQRGMFDVKAPGSVGVGGEAH